MREIGSAVVETLTSDGLADFRQMILDARKQRKEILVDLQAANVEHTARRDELGRKKRSWFRSFFKKRIAHLEELVPMLAAEVERLKAWLDATHIQVVFETGDDARRTYASLTRGYDALRNCTKIWDVTADRSTNRVAERTTASRVVDRRPVALEYAQSDLIQFEGQAMRFANANGEDLLLYPGMILMARGDSAFALLDLRDVELEWGGSRFIEDESVPADSEVVGHTWAKANKDGSPDRRFNGNYQIPVCLYGKLSFSSSSGLCEEYQFSNAGAAMAFGSAYDAYKAALQ